MPLADSRASLLTDATNRGGAVMRPIGARAVYETGRAAALMGVGGPL